VGTSAGSIVCARLAAGRRMRRPQVAGNGAAAPPPSIDEPPGRRLPFAAGAARALAVAISPLVDPLLALGAPGGAVARAALLARAPRGERRLDELVDWVEHIGARFDGRLRVCCVDRAAGRRVVFGAPGAPPAPVGLAVAASCSIPGVFEPVDIGGREYVDGGAWSPTNMDAARVTRGAQVLCLNPTGSISAIGLASRSIARVEALVLERRGARVQIVAPDDGSLDAIGPNLMDPGRRRQVIAAGAAQGRRLGAS
jgi:NTE family protein